MESEISKVAILINNKYDPDIYTTKETHVLGTRSFGGGTVRNRIKHLVYTQEERA
jgi:hypothetical protein